MWPGRTIVGPNRSTGRPSLCNVETAVSPAHEHRHRADQLGRALVGQQRYAEAERELLTGYEILTKQTSPSVSWLRSAREDLVELYKRRISRRKRDSSRRSREGPTLDGLIVFYSRARPVLARIAGAMRCSGSTSSTAPRSMASLGMPKTTRRRLVLRDGGGAGALHLEQAVGAVVAHAGQDDADGVGAGGLGHRAEQHVDAGPVPGDERPVARARRRSWAPLRTSSVAVAGRDQRAPGRTRSPSSASFTSIAQSWSRRSANAAVKPSGMCWTMTMPGASSGRLEEHAQRLGAAGGGADGDHLVGRDRQRARASAAARRRR